MKELLKSVLFTFFRLDERLFKSKLLIPYVILKHPFWMGSYMTKPRKRFNKTLVIYRFDAIGDYVLFRNVLEQIKESPRFKGYFLIFVGNEIYKDFAECYDSQYVDKFVWLNIDRMSKSNDYFYRKMHEVNLERAEYLINPHFSKTFVTELAKKYFNAKCSITLLGDDTRINKRALIDFEEGYQEKVKIPEHLIFELDKNLFFIEEILREKQSPEVFGIKPYKSENVRTPYLLIFPGAAVTIRRWNIDNFSQLVTYILTNSEFDVFICGTENEKNLGGYLSDKLGHSRRVRNLVGQVNLAKIASMINDAVMVIGNESAPIHISAVCKTPYICISNANHIGRFHPYPKKYFDRGNYVYPPNIEIESFEDLLKYHDQYKLESDLNINEISVEEAIRVFDKVFQAVRASI